MKIKTASLNKAVKFDWRHVHNALLDFDSKMVKNIFNGETAGAKGNYAAMRHAKYEMIKKSVYVTMNPGLKELMDKDDRIIDHHYMKKSDIKKATKEPLLYPLYTPRAIINMLKGPNINSDDMAWYLLFGRYAINRHIKDDSKYSFINEFKRLSDIEMYRLLCRMEMTFLPTYSITASSNDKFELVEHSAANSISQYLPDGSEVDFAEFDGMSPYEDFTGENSNDLSAVVIYGEIKAFSIMIGDIYLEITEEEKDLITNKLKSMYDFLGIKKSFKGYDDKYANYHVSNWRDRELHENLNFGISK